MAFGFRILTTRGYSDLSDIRAIRRVWTSGRRTAVSNTLTLAAGTLPGGPYLVGVDVADRRNAPNVEVSGQLVSWTGVTNAQQGPSQDFVINIYKIA